MERWFYSRYTQHNLGAGTYTVTIVDGTPCTIVKTFTIVEPAAMTVSGNVTHAIVCNDPLSGAIDITVAGGTPPYTFTWLNGATTEDLSGITSGIMELRLAIRMGVQSQTICGNKTTTYTAQCKS